jgi:magnesium transporter
MNFDHMPELQWTLEYQLALLMMLLVSLYNIFKGRGWL